MEIRASIFAVVGLAVGALGTAVATLVTGLFGLAWWKTPLAVAGLVLVISGPSMLVAALKLHSRSLAPMLDANGWAINARVRINIPFGATLTQLPRLPRGARGRIADPFAAKRAPWLIAVVLIVIAALLLAWWAVGLHRVP